MNIILLDNDNIKQNLEHLIEILKLEWKIFTPITIDEGINIYINNEIDIVIVDFSLIDKLNIFNEILKINPKIKTLTVSETLSCSDNNGCEDCIINFNRKRLLKPVSVKGLYDTINNFDNLSCGYFKGFENIPSLLPKILERFSDFEFSNENNSIVCKSKNSDHSINQLLDIVEILKKYNIQHQILDGYNISLNN